MFKNCYKRKNEDSSRSSNSIRSNQSGDSEPADGETLCSESESDEEDSDTSLSGLMQVIITYYTVLIYYVLAGFIVNSGEEEVIGDNDGDDEADDLLGLGRKRTRLVRNKLAGNNLLIQSICLVSTIIKYIVTMLRSIVQQQQQ
jgi:hypothetical protein